MVTIVTLFNFIKYDYFTFGSCLSCANAHKHATFIRYSQNKTRQLVPGLYSFKQRLSGRWSCITWDEFFSDCFECVSGDGEVILKVLINLISECCAL